MSVWTLLISRFCATGFFVVLKDSRSDSTNHRPRHDGARLVDSPAVCRPISQPTNQSGAFQSANRPISLSVGASRMDGWTMMGRREGTVPWGRSRRGTIGRALQRDAESSVSAMRSIRSIVPRIHTERETQQQQQQHSTWMAGRDERRTDTCSISLFTTQKLLPPPKIGASRDSSRFIFPQNKKEPLKFSANSAQD